jgi:transposase
MKPSTILKYSIGLDISKDSFDACFSAIDSSQKVTVKATRKFTNNENGFKQFYQWELKHKKQDVPMVFCMEATGVYYENIAWYLHLKDQQVSVVLPNKAKKYLQALGLKSKNDKIDAKGLARMAAEQNLGRWLPISNEIYGLRYLTRHHEQLQGHRTRANNQVHAMGHSHFTSKSILKQQQQMIKLVDKQLEEIEKQIILLIDNDVELKLKFGNISKIKGISYLSFATIVAETNGFAAFNNQRQLVSYAGYDVVENQSGRYSGKTKISKRGNSHLRRIMHMPALNAVRHKEPVFLGLFERVYDRTKIKMKGYVAVQRKLLVLIYALWKKNGAYVALSAKKENGISGNDEPKLLFSLVSAGDTKEIAPANARATLDEHPCNESPEVLFSLLQSY